MSGYRRYSRSRYGYRRRRYYGYRYRRYGMSTARKANIAYRSTRKMVKREEIKTHEHYLNIPDSASGAYTVNDIAKVPMGTSEDTRIGNKISPTSLKIKIKLAARTGGDQSINVNFTRMYRIMVVVWKGEGDVNSGNILDGSDATIPALLRPKNDQYKYNSKILYDKVHRLDSQIQNKYIPITIKRALRKYPISFDSVQSPVSYRMNGYALLIFPENKPTDDTYRIQIASKLSFKD